MLMMSREQCAAAALKPRSGGLCCRKDMHFLCWPPRELGRRGHPPPGQYLCKPDALRTQLWTFSSGQQQAG